MSESSGSFVMSGHRIAGQAFVWFDALFAGRISTIKHYFAVSRKSPNRVHISGPRFAY